MTDSLMNTATSTEPLNPITLPVPASHAMNPSGSAPAATILLNAAPNLTDTPLEVGASPGPPAHALPASMASGPAKPPPIRVDAALGKMVALSEADQLRLMTLEYSIGESIVQGWRSFVDIGLALMEIRKDGLYAAEFSSFEEYCQVKWDFKQSKAHYLMAAAQVVKSLAALPDVPRPERESPLRPLLKLKPEDAQRAWKLAAEKTGGRRITARIVRNAVQELELGVEPVKGRSRQKERLDLRRMIGDCFGELMKLLSHRADYPSVMEKAQELHGLVERLYARGQTASTRAGQQGEGSKCNIC